MIALKGIVKKWSEITLKKA